jgi:hypothetical protein
MIHTEHTIQNALYKYLGLNFAAIFPNMDVITGHEADILAVTKSGYAYEYEIKISLSDFRADKKKRAKHASLSGQYRTIQHPYSYSSERTAYVCHDAPDNPHEAIRLQCYPNLRPKEFWYVVSGFDVPDNELPEYAGLMRYTGRTFERIKNAPRLEAQKVNPERIIHATKNMLYRYWAMRIEQDKNNGNRRTDDQNPRLCNPNNDITETYSRACQSG